MFSDTSKLEFGSDMDILELIKTICIEFGKNFLIDTASFFCLEAINLVNDLINRNSTSFNDLGVNFDTCGSDAESNEVDIEKPNFSFHKENTIKIIFNDNTESNNFKVVTDYRGELGKGNTIYYYKEAYQPIHMMLAGIVMASGHRMKDIKKVIVNGDDFDFVHMCVPTLMENAAPHQLTEWLNDVLINEHIFNQAESAALGLNGCINYYSII